MAVKYVKEFEFGGSVSHKKPPGMKKDLAPAKPFRGPNQGYAKGGMAAARGMPVAARPNAPARPMADRMESPPKVGRGQGYAKGGMTKGEKKVGKVMREYKAGELHSGSKKGPVVKSQKQAVAIALSEARKAGAKIPKKAEGGEISKGPSVRSTARKGRLMGRMERRSREAMERAEKYAPGLSIDMKAKGGMPVHRRKPMYGGGKC